MEDVNESMDEQQRQQRLQNLEVTSLSPEDRRWLDAEEKRLMNKYEQIILQAEREELLKESTGQKEPERRPPAWIVRTHRVQAYWDDGNNRKVRVRREELQDDFVRDFATHQGRELEPDSYAVDVVENNIPNDESWTVRLQAAEATADLLIQSLDEWLDYQVDSHNYRLTDQRGEIVEVQLDAALPVGASLVQLKRHGKREGLFIEIKKPESALAQVAGDRMAHCAIMRSVNGRPCPIIPIFKGVKQYAKEHKEPLMLELQCLVPEDASLLWSKHSPQQVEKKQAVPMEVIEEENGNDKINKDPTVAAITLGRVGDLPPINNTNKMAAAEEEKNEVINLCSSDDECLEDTPLSRKKAAKHQGQKGIKPQNSTGCSVPMVVEHNKANSTDKTDIELLVAAAWEPKQDQLQPQEKASIQDTTMGQCLKQQMPHPEFASTSTTTKDPTQLMVSMAATSACLVQGPESPASSLTHNSSQLSDPSLQKMHKQMGYHHEGYKHFSNKYGGIVEEEFSIGASIHKSSAMSYMWSQHKKHFGNECSEECPCVKDLAALTATVVSDHLQKKSSWANPHRLRPGEYSIGIMGNFASTFVPMLTMERPGETSTKLLQRLLAMWEIHRRNRIFGIQCQEGCDCCEGWELVFHKGSLQTETVERMKSCKGSSATGKVGLGPIPRKRKSPKNVDTAVLEKKTKILPPSKPGPLVVAAAAAAAASRISSRPALQLKTAIQGNTWFAVSTSVPAQKGVDNGHPFAASPTMRGVSQADSHSLHQQQTISDTGAQASVATGSSSGVSQVFAHQPTDKDTEKWSLSSKTAVVDKQSIARAVLDNRRAVRREQARDVAKSESAFADEGPSMQDSSLPHLEDPDWLVPIKAKKHHCWDWKRGHRCTRQTKQTCFFIHKHGPWGESLERMWSEMGMHTPPEFEKYAPEFERCAQSKCEKVGPTKWWTAGYISHRHFKAPRQAFYAEGGSARISSQGVSWYPTQEEAYAALKKAAMVSAWAAEQRRTPTEGGLPPVSTGGFRSNNTSQLQSNSAHVSFQRHSDYSYYAGSAGLRGEGSEQQGRENPYCMHNHHEQGRLANVCDQRSPTRSSSSDYYDECRPARSGRSAQFGSHRVQNNGHGQRYSRRYSS